ncbi:MAG: hypothetical protein HQK75_09290 [Candidatus Magnetomorum sp.]|nr:hypothetical protein [Candidatus Magnetomorum sp.]
MKKKSTKPLILCIHWAAIVLFVFFLKLNDIAPTLHHSYTDNIFRIGVIPWSDAKAWIDGAFQIADGEKLTGVPTCRPLYPLFLSCFAGMMSGDYLYFIFIQLLLSSTCIGMAFLILKTNLSQSYYAGFFFIACLILWRTDFVTVFLTENLGMAFLIICMALIWASLETTFFPMLLAGYFMSGLSQATRPWCVMTLATLPFLAAFIPRETLKKFSWNLHRSIDLTRKQLFIALLVSIVAGYAFQPTATWLFNSPGQRYANNSKTLYGQVVGGKGWTAIYDDPIIQDSINSGRSPEEIDRVIFQQCLTLFLDKPMNFFIACLKGYVNYFKTIPNAFSGNMLSPFHWCIIFLFFIFFTGIKKSLLFFYKNPRLLVFLFMSIISFYFFPIHFLCCGLIAGCLFILVEFPSPLSIFSFLYIFGILFSIPMVGCDGGERVKIGSDIFLYMITAKGITQGFLLFYQPTIDENPSAIIWQNHPKLFWLIPVSAAIMLVMIPLVIYSNHFEDEKQRPCDLSIARQIQKQMNTPSLAIGPMELDQIWHHYPKPSFENIHNRPGFFIIRYARRNAIFLEKNQGLTRSRYPFLHWPVSPLAIDRTILVLEKRYSIFPGIHPSQLAAYENQDIIVYGTLHARKRPYMHATGFVLNVSHIGVIDSYQNIQWRSLIN